MVVAGEYGIAGNLHRAELTVQERADHIDKWGRLMGENLAQVVSVSQHGRVKGRGDEGGVHAAVRELGIDCTDAQRAVKTASIVPEAKEAARAAGLDDNQSALLEVVRAAQMR